MVVIESLAGGRLAESEFLTIGSSLSLLCVCAAVGDAVDQPGIHERPARWQPCQGRFCWHPCSQHQVRDRTNRPLPPLVLLLLPCRCR